MSNLKETYKLAAFAALAIFVTVVALYGMLPFIPALLWATVLSVLTFPLYRRLDGRLSKVKLLGNGRSEILSSLAVTILTLVVICIPFVILGLGLFLQLGELASQLDSGNEVTLDSILASVDKAIRPIASQVGAGAFSLSQYVQEHRPQIISDLRQPVQNFARQAAWTLLMLTFALLAQFFMLKDAHRLRAPVLDLLPLPRAKSEAMLERLSATVRAVFVGTVLVALVQGAIIGITYALVGVPNSLMLGVISALVCIIPMLGAPVVYVPVAIYLFSQGKTNQGIILLIVGLVVVSQIDNVLKPLLIGGQVNLHPVAVFFAVLAGVGLFGAIGVMAGPMLLTILLSLAEVVRERVRETPAVATTN